MSHTSGPWQAVVRKYGMWRVVGPETEEVNVLGRVYRPVIAENIGGHEEGDDGESNARLIAAAPELLSALEQLLEIGERGYIERRETGKPTWHVLPEITKIASAAIAKAKGGA